MRILSSFVLVLIVLLCQCKPKKSVHNKSEKLNYSASFKRGIWECIGPFGSPIPLSGANEWTATGAGRFMCVYVHPKNNQIIYIGHATSGLFKSIDGGRTWQQKLNFPFSTGINQIIGFKNDDNHLLASASMDIGNSKQYGFGLIESFDGGETWVRNNLQFNPQEYQLDQMNDVAIIDNKKENKIIAISDKSIYISNDKAVTWQLIDKPGFTLKNIIVNPKNEKQVFITGNQIIMTNDGGSTWTNVSSGFFKKLGIKPSQYSRVNLCFSKSNFKKIYVGISSSKCHLFIANTDSLNEPKLTGINTVPPNFFRFVMSSVYNELSKQEQVFIGGVRLHKLNDKLSNAETITNPNVGNSQFAHDDINYIHLAKNNHLYIATDGGIDLSEDEGKTWRSLSQNSNLNTALLFGFDINEQGVMMTGTQDNGIFRFMNSTWHSLVYYGDGGRVVACNDSNDFFVSYGKQNYKLTQNGMIIDYEHAGEQTMWFDYRMGFHKKTKTFYLANKNLYKKTNESNFELITSQLTIDRDIKALWVNPDDNKEIWMAKDDATWGAALVNKLFYSNDGGDSWYDYTKNCPLLMWRSISDIHVNKDGIIALAIDGFDKENTEYNRVLFSYDNGETFVNQSKGLSNFPVNCVLYANGKWFCGSNNGVYVLNINNEWEPFETGFPVTVVSELKYFKRENALYASTFGRSLWRYGF